MPRTSPAAPAPLVALLRMAGLDDKQAAVYLVLLGLKAARATDIARAARESRPYTYELLRQLRVLGLVSEAERGRVIEFTAEPPEKLFALLDERASGIEQARMALRESLPALRDLDRAPSGKPRLTLIEGLPGMKELYRELFREEFVAVFNPASVYETFPGSLPPLLLGPAAKELAGRELIADGPHVDHHLADHPRTPSYRCRILPGGVRFRTDLIVAGDVSALFAYDEDLSIVRIENAAIADSFRAWFEVMWDIGREPPRTRKPSRKRR